LFAGEMDALVVLGTGDTTMHLLQLLYLLSLMQLQFLLEVFHSCALKEDKSVVCWGEGNSGRLGNGGGYDINTPVTVSSLTDAIAISLGGSHSCALKEDKSVVCWGVGVDGQLGYGGTSSVNKPVAVSSLSNAIAISLGHGHSCALKEAIFSSFWYKSTNQHTLTHTLKTSHQHIVIHSYMQSQTHSHTLKSLHQHTLIHTYTHLYRCVQTA
jgi:alpha-tubulin suppressor-like RCC1 family protein